LSKERWKYWNWFSWSSTLFQTCWSVMSSWKMLRGI
jgi:hypothetical protein